MLIEKTHQIGIRGRLIKWLVSFLSNRTQTVVVEGVHSSVVDVLSGVPQGTVLEPVLFLIYLCDIEEVVENSLISSFADDTRLLKEIRVNDDQGKLQEDLSNVHAWASRKQKFSLIKK